MKYSRLLICALVCLSAAACDDGTEDSDAGDDDRDSGSVRRDSGTRRDSGGSGDPDTGTPPVDSGPQPTLLDFQITMMLISAHVGQDIHLRVFDSTDAPIGNFDGVAALETIVMLPDIVEDGEDYTVRFWIDSEENDMCDPQPPGGDFNEDHQWELDESADETGLIMDWEHDGDWTNVCPYWE